MKRPHPWIIVLAAGCGAPGAVEPGPLAPPTRLLVSKDAEADLKDTRVVPALQARHEAGKNLLWCASFQLSWNALHERLGGAPRFRTESPFVEQLNARTVTADVAEEEALVARAGWIREGVLRELQEELARKFPGKKIDDLIPKEAVEDPEAMLAFGYLARSLPFPEPFERYPQEFRFQGRSVSAFGVRPGGPRRESREQVSVLSYRSPEDFTVMLAPAEDHVLVARLKPKATLLETILEVLGRIGNPVNEGMREGDELRIPCFRFDLTRDYKELRGRYTAPPAAASRGCALVRAWQVVRFSLDESGMKLESPAGSETTLGGPEVPLPPRRLVCDGPFLLLALKGNATLPYFAAWIENAELLSPN